MASVNVGPCQFENLKNIFIKAYKPHPVGGEPMVGFPKGAASLWSGAGLVPRLRMRACKVAGGDLTSEFT